MSMHNLILQKELNSEVKEWTQIANYSTSLLNNLVCDTLDYLEIRSGRFKPNNSTFCLKKAMKEAFELITFQM